MSCSAGAATSSVLLPVPVEPAGHTRPTKVRSIRLLADGTMLFLSGAGCTGGRIVTSYPGHWC